MTRLLLVLIWYVSDKTTNNILDVDNESNNDVMNTFIHSHIKCRRISHSSIMSHDDPSSPYAVTSTASSPGSLPPSVIEESMSSQSASNSPTRFSYCATDDTYGKLQVSCSNSHLGERLIRRPTPPPLLSRFPYKVTDDDDPDRTANVDNKAVSSISY